MNQLDEKMKSVSAAGQQQNAKAYYGDTCGAQAGVGQAVGIPLAVHRLQLQREDDQRKSQLRDHVIDILQRHPDFDEFLEVLRSGLV